MSNSDFPDLPSDKELGLTEEDLKELEGELSDDGPEMSAEEMAALFGEEPPAPVTIPRPTPSGAPVGGGKEAAKAARAKAKAEKRTAAATKKKAKAAASEGQPTLKDEPAESKEAAARPAAAPVDDGPRSKWRGPATAALLFAACMFASSRTGVPRPVPSNAGEAEFSSARAMVTLVEIAREAHPTGSPEHARVRQYLVDRLTALGLEPEIQTAPSLIQNASFARSATVRNVVARLAGTSSTGAVLVTAHYDSRELSRGAADDGAGVVTILEALRAIQASGPLQNDLIVLFTDAEELGLLGSRAFVDGHRWMGDVRLAISIEMRGGGGPSIMFETGEENGWIVRALAASDPTAYGNSMSHEIYKRLPNDTDFTPFREAGIQGLNFAAIDNAHVYHQSYDSPENVSESTLQHHGLHALNVLRHLGNESLAEVDAPNVAYFHVPGLGFFVYDEKWILPISGVLLALFALAVIVTRVVTGGLTGILIGAGVSIAGVALSYGAAILLVGWLPGFHPELDSLYGSAYHSEGWYLLALAAAVLTIVTSLHGIVRRFVHLSSLALGALIVPLAGAAWLSYEMPLAAMNFQWPVAAALSVILLLGILRKNASGVVGWGLAVVAALAVLAFLEPLTELLWLALSFRMAPALAVLTAVTAYLCLPAMDGMRHPNSWWAPLTGLVLCGAALGIGLLMSRTTPDRPSPSTLAYALDHEAQEALWVTTPLSDTAHMAGRKWAVAAAGGAFGAVRDLGEFGYRAGDVPVVSADVVDVPGPEIFIESGESIDGVRRVLMSVRSQIGAEMLRFQYAKGSGTRIRSINGKPLTQPDSLLWADHWGEPDPVVLLELDVPEGEALELNVIEHTLRPGELLDSDPFERPETLAPDVTWLSDRAMLLTRFSTRDLAGDGEVPYDLQQMLDSMTGASAARTTPDTAPVGSTPVPADTATTSADTTATAPVDTTTTTPVDTTTTTQVDTTTAAASRHEAGRGR